MGAARRAHAQAAGVRRASGGVRTGAGAGVARAAAAGVRSRARDGGRAGWLLELGDVGVRACGVVSLSPSLSVRAFSSVIQTSEFVPVCLFALCVAGGAVHRVWSAPCAVTDFCFYL